MVAWREIGDLPQDKFVAILAGTPLANETNDIYVVAKGYTALLLAQAKIESNFGRSDLARTKHNFLGQRPRDGDGFKNFHFFVDCAAYYVGKLSDPNYAYANTTTLEEFVHTYAPSSDGNNEIEYVSTIRSLLESWGATTTDQIPEEGPMALDLDVDLTGRGSVPLRDKKAWITVHNTGNNVPRQSERKFVNDGGGDAGVMYHFAVDETGVTQIMPLWKRGVHSGNFEGNATSIAIETCELREPWSQIKENVAQTIAAIVLRDPRVRFDSSAYEFSLDRIREHRDWPGANPNCPRRIIQTDGGVERIVARARQIVAGTTPAPAIALPHAVGGKDGQNWVDESGNEWIWLHRRITPKHPVQTYEYANVLSGKGPLLPAGKSVIAYRAVAAIGPDETPEIWFTTKLGWRGLMSDALAA